jgi:hypothetical protein
MAIITAARPSLLRVCGAGESDLAVEDNLGDIVVWEAHAVFAFISSYSPYSNLLALLRSCAG